MFENEIEIIKKIFSNYFYNTGYLIIFLLAIVIIFIEEEKKENKSLLVYYPVVMLAITLNPVFFHYILKIVPENVYYRFIWCVPIGIVIAYFGVMLVSKLNKKYKKIIVSIVFIGIVAYSGHFVYTNEVFEEVNNLYKLPDEYVQVINIISGIPIENKKTMTSTEMIGYVRQIDASIKLAFERRSYADYDNIPIVKYYLSGNVKSLISICKNKNVNIIVYDNSIQLSSPLENYGYNLYAQTKHYDIYVLSKELNNVEIDEENIEIDGLKNNYKISIVNDLHLVVPYDDVIEEQKQEVAQRYELFKTANGQYSCDLWDKISDKINALKSDYVVFAGDMVDYISSSNIACLKNGMNKIKQDKMYIRADHDYGRTYNKGLSKEYIDSLEKTIDEDKDIFCKDLGEILIVGINNSTSQITSEAIIKLKDIFQQGKPIILVTHVPFNSKVDKALEQKSKEVWDNRNLTWDENGTTYTADKNTKELLNMVYSDNTPVKAIITGHLHFKYVGKITENVVQYVFDASYNGKIGIINIIGK